MCLAKGKVEPATIADHIVPHKGQEQLFWFGELQSLCASHHSTKTMTTERGVAAKDYSTDIGIDGFPIDPKHPVYSTNVLKR
jgi:hypothetical protein